jgi:hypothetical protein
MFLLCYFVYLSLDCFSGLFSSDCLLFCTEGGWNDLRMSDFLSLFWEFYTCINSRRLYKTGGETRTQMDIRSKKNMNMNTNTNIRTIRSCILSLFVFLKIFKKIDHNWVCYLAVQNLFLISIGKPQNKLFSSAVGLEK